MDRIRLLGCSSSTTGAAMVACLVVWAILILGVHSNSSSLVAAEAGTEADVLDGEVQQSHQHAANNNEAGKSSSEGTANAIAKDSDNDDGITGEEPDDGNRGPGDNSPEPSAALATEATATALNDTSASTSSTSTRVDCAPRNLTQDELPTVKLINSTEIQEYMENLPNATQSECALILFYYPWCPFSSRTAPHFNALGRLYPQLHVLALDAYANNGINMRFGLVGVPSVLFIHNGKVLAKYNDSDPTIEGFVTFINKITGLSPASSPILTEDDQTGPVPTKPIPQFDYVLIASWLFVLFCTGYLFGKSSFCRKLMESVRNTWREAEAHQHLD